MLTKSLAALALGCALVTTAAGAEERPKFVYLTQTGIDNSFWQSIKKGMDDACTQFQADCQLIFTTQTRRQMRQRRLQTIGQHRQTHHLDQTNILFFDVV